MNANTKNFGTISIEDDKIITFQNGIIGFPELRQFALIYNSERGKEGSIHWLQSMNNPEFALPVMDPLIAKTDYNPEVDDNLLRPLGELNVDDMLILVTVTVPKQIKDITVNLKAPIVINAITRLAAQVITDDNYDVKYPIYDILQMKKAEQQMKLQGGN